MSIASARRSRSVLLSAAALVAFVGIGSVASANKVTGNVGEKALAPRHELPPVLGTPTGLEATVSITVPNDTPTYGTVGNALNVVSTHDLAALTGLTPAPGNVLAVHGIGFVGTISAPSPSYLSEVGMFFDDTTGTSGNGIVFRPLSGQDVSNSTPQPATSGGIIDLATVGLDPITTLANNTLRIEYYDSFDDNAGAIDGYINTGTITLDVREYTPPPPPAVLYSGALATSDLTFNRPSSLTTLSSVGTSVFHDVQPFYVGTTGSYTFEQQASVVDSYLLIYSPSFNSGTPLVNLVALDDDSGATGGNSLITVSLTAGVQYYFVNSSFDNGEVGDYNVLGAGAGAITLGLVVVPEPATLSVLLGAGVTLLARRRRA